jgi:sodium-dependent dicarboxylate transporter 2/3/5
MNTSKRLGLFLGPILFLIVLLLPTPLLSKEGDAVIAVALWMVIWWLSEAVSISVTALLPLLLFPLLDIMPIAEVGNNYGSPIIFLFLEALSWLWL